MRTESGNDMTNAMYEHCDIPEGMTLSEYRRRRAQRRTGASRTARLRRVLSRRSRRR